MTQKTSNILSDNDLTNLDLESGVLYITPVRNPIFERYMYCYFNTFQFLVRDDITRCDLSRLHITKDKSNYIPKNIMSFTTYITNVNNGALVMLPSTELAEQVYDALRYGRVKELPRNEWVHLT